MLAYLWTVIADLYGDSAKINGRHNVSDQLRNLRKILNNYDFESLCSFFAENLWIKTTIFLHLFISEDFCNFGREGKIKKR